MTERIKNLIANLKHVPGCYLMHDKDGTVIYVGKAKDLYKRVSQYFLRPQAGKVFKMVCNVDWFETIITANEKEALVLEENLIKKHWPRYNILLKNGCHYPYIALRKAGDPYLVIKRNQNDHNYSYFGPFPNSSAAYEMIALLNKIFPLRKCRVIPDSPCLYYHMNQCLAPCIHEVSEEENDDLREKILSFLRGNNQSVRSEVKNKMLEASERMDYEQANEYKKTLAAIDHINTDQNVEIKDRTDRDIFAYSTRNSYLALAVLLFRNGSLLGKKTFVVEQFGDEKEQVTDLITQFYHETPLPKEIVLNSEEITESLRDYLDVDFISVTKGRLNDLICTAKENANNALDEYFLSARLDDDKLALLEELGAIAGIRTPYHIELFDNSHLQGSNPVGAMVAFVNGEPAKRLYRKFRIEHDEARDDLKSMEEVVYRHYSRLVSENQKLPDLILVDGGLNQIHAAEYALIKADAEIPLLGLVKNDRHQTAGLMDKDGNVKEIENKSLFFLLTRMQDEVHRFAITYHTNKRDKAMTVSLLDGVKGLGDKRKESVNRVYKDIEELRKASVEELAQILPHEVAEALYARLHNLD